MKIAMRFHRDETGNKPQISRVERGDESSRSVCCPVHNWRKVQKRSGALDAVRRSLKTWHSQYIVKGCRGVTLRITGRQNHGLDTYTSNAYITDKIEQLGKYLVKYESSIGEAIAKPAWKTAAFAASGHGRALHVSTWERERRYVFCPGCCCRKGDHLTS